MAPCFPYHILLNLKILKNEIGTIPRIGHYTADMGRCQHNHFRSFLVKEFLDGYRVEQVKLGMAAADKVCKTSLAQVIHDRRSDKASVTGNIYL